MADEKPVNYQEKIAGQQALVDKLVADYAEKPSPELEIEIRRRRDTLLHLKNLAKPDAKGRAQAAESAARAAALSKAITQPLA
ncbi:MAG: hypothetical protein ABI539_09520 [Acidobacteriota bacterium]